MVSAKAGIVPFRIESLYRHAEPGSASIAPPALSVRAEKWTLNPVQGDDEERFAVRSNRNAFRIPMSVLGGSRPAAFGRCLKEAVIPDADIADIALCTLASQKQKLNAKLCRLLLCIALHSVGIAIPNVDRTLGADRWVKVMRIMKFGILSAFLMGACSHAQPNETISPQYNTVVSGLFIESSARPICQIQVSFNGDLDGSIRKLWLSRSGIKLLATSIEQDKGVVRMVLASPEVCSPEGVGNAHKRLMKYFGPISIGMASPLKLFDHNQVQKELGLLDINTSNFVSGIKKECKIDREFKKEISYENLIDIRYSMAIPLVFYSKSGNREFLAFDSHCEFKEDFIKLIDINYK